MSIAIPLITNRVRIQGNDTSITGIDVVETRITGSVSLLQSNDAQLNYGGSLNKSSNNHDSEDDIIVHPDIPFITEVVVPVSVVH